MDNYVGKRIDGRYEILEVVGVGGMAVVYKAYDNIDDRIVAIKILKDEYLANEEFRRRFKNESKAIAILSHPNIVKVYDVSFGDRLQYIVMEYVEGITLKEYIEQKGLMDWNECLFFIIQILKALQHAHDKGIVHRDVKPQNIMMLKNGTIKVTDFGIARFSRGETRTMTEKAIGSVHYISPEQAKGEFTDEKADIYSVGVVLYEMLTGKLPFEADNAVSVAIMQLQAEAALPRTINSSIPVGFEQITMKAMQKSPRERYQSAAEMLLDLEELKKNPSIKFDYQTYFVDSEPTRYVGKIQEKRTSDMRSKQMDNDYDDGDMKIRNSVQPAVTEAQKKVAQMSSQPAAAVAVKDVYDDKEKNKAIPIIAGVGVAVVIFLIVLLCIKIFGGQKIEVEKFIGLNFAEEIENNEEYKDKYNFEISYVTSTDREEGTVYDQDPKPGTSIRKGGTVKLSIVASGEGIMIPDLTDSNYRQAVATLENLGFVVSAIPEENNEKSIGEVIRTDPAANTSALSGSTIVVYYAADASAAKQFKMPSLEGKSLEEAKEIIAKNKLVLAKTETTNSSVEKDYVLSQSPVEGSPVNEGEGVILTVSTGINEGSKDITLPKAGSLNVKVVVGEETVSQETVDTSSRTTYTLKVAGSGSGVPVKVYLNDNLYMEMTADFTRDTVSFSAPKTYTLQFYVDVLGLTENEAISKLAAAGYKNVSVNYDYSSTGTPGTVVNQSPSYSSAPGLDKTALINITVAKKSEETDPVAPSSESDPEIPEESESDGDI